MVSRDELLVLVPGDFRASRGHPQPLGASLRRQGINFAIFSANATAMRLLLYRPGAEEPVLEWPLDPRFNRTGNVWHVAIAGLDPGVEYAWRAIREPNPSSVLHRFDQRNVLLDPFAKAVAGAPVWRGTSSSEGPGPRVRPRRNRVIDDEFDWGISQPLNVHLADSIIYEIHVRGFTAHASSGVAHRGMYRGIVEKIPYLHELGVTAIELMPVTEFEENDNPHRDPVTGAPLVNFWGYQPLAFFAPKAGYAESGPRGGEVTEFKEMVKALHEAGIEVILDMVFNHTGEGNEGGPTVCWRGLDNATYYLLEPETGRYLDYSGCGNTLNCNHPVVRGQILACLRYWVTEMHVDGFRFDLASILGRGTDGSVLANPPLLEVIAADPVLAHTKLIAEAWDAAGLYQVGSFPSWGRWAEWNGKFRDDVRRFVRGDPGMVPVLATRLAGSSDLYQGDGRGPYHSVNFITSHDGYTLMDLVSYEQKHNERNGEGNRDGHPDNLGANYGVEGFTRSRAVRALRKRQAKNMAALLLASQGAPMILGGDELGRSQGGNNNAYCQDNETSWVDWRLRQENADLFRFFQLMIRFRKAHPALRRRSFVEMVPGRPWVRWQGTRLMSVDWSAEAKVLGMHIDGEGQDDDILILVNSHPGGRHFELPPLSSGRAWHRAVDTFLPSPEDIAETGAESLVPDRLYYEVGGRTVVVLVGR